MKYWLTAFVVIPLMLSACGGGGSDSGSSGSSSSSSSSTSSSSGGELPTHTSNGDPYCTPAGSDSDGDGWGWENDATCVVRNSAADPDAGDSEGCIIGVASMEYCETDNGNWGFENGSVCISESFCPANRTAADQTVMSPDLNENSSDVAEAVYDYLRSIWGMKILSGQQDLTWKDEIDMYQRVLDDTGKAPAIMGYDFMNYPGNGDGTLQTEEAIDHWNRGGLVTFCWHWRGTSNEFYTDQTSFEIPISLETGQLDTTSEAYATIEADIDTIAAELAVLRNAGVPVLWRPLHEASGGWFWWGRSRTDGIPPAYANVILWRHLYDRLVNEHNLNNLIWVWNGQSAAWYPGDEYTDIVSVDIYDGAKNYESQIGMYSTVAAYPQQTKMVALSENSNIPDPDEIAADGAWWLFFVVWNDGDSAAGVTNEGNFWTGEYYNTNAHKTHVYNHELVVTLDELPEFQGAP